MQKLAIYDMDRTITVRGTYTGFLIHMVSRRAPWRIIFSPLLIVGFAAYILKIFDKKRLKTFNQRLFLGSKPKLAELQPHIEEYAEKVLANNIHQQALAQIEKDRSEGRKLVLATASYELYVHAIAKKLRFDDVIATRLELDGGPRVLPEICGDNCYGEAKLTRIKSYLKAQGMKRDDLHIRAYSDHISDAPMLKFADEAIATTPSSALRNLAKQRDWKIVDWD